MTERGGREEDDGRTAELDGTRAEITQFEGFEGRVLEGVDCVLKQSGRLKTDTDSVRVQLVENLQVDMRNYLLAAFADSETATTTYRGRLGGSVLGAATSITDS